MSRKDAAQRLRDALRSRAERDEGLPRAICRVCGGWASKGRGECRPQPEFVDARTQAQRDAALSALPAEVHGWRRTCAACVEADESGSLARTMLFAAIGLDGVTEREATTILAGLVSFDPRIQAFRGLSAESHGAGSGKPWGHVTDAERECLRRLHADLIAARMPRPSSWGGCGMCGIAAALGEWWEAPSTLHWPDGAPVALCASCAVVWQRRGSPSDINDLRRVGVESATGWPVPLGNEAPSSFRLFCESRAADAAGLAAPWSWSAGLIAYIESVWESQPNLAPEGRRSEFQQRQDERYRERAALYRQQRERREESTW